MNLVSWAKKEFARLSTHKPKRLLPPPPSEESVKCLHMSMVNEVILKADLQCTNCRMRIADVISEFNGVDSILVHVLEKKVTLTLTNDDK